MDNRQDNPVSKGSVVVPVSSTDVNPAYDAVKYTQEKENYEKLSRYMLLYIVLYDGKIWRVL